MTWVLAHGGEPLEPHDVWTAWNVDPLLLGALGAVVALYVRGGSPRGLSRHRPRAFSGALLALSVAFLSPLEAMTGSLASAHMVQHVLLVLVCAPLLAVSRPGTRLLRGLPVRARIALGRTTAPARNRMRGLGRALEHPASAWALHVGTLWFWHASGPYEAAVGHEVLHGLEHAMFLVTGVLVWRVALGPAARTTSHGAAVLMVFGLAVQSVMLSALLTFASSPWYAGYVATTPAWGLSALADQQLAGLLMWVPGGILYVLVAVGLMLRWLDASEAGMSA